jgi:hypothetical protein
MQRFACVREGDERTRWQVSPEGCSLDDSCTLTACHFGLSIA